MPGTFESEREKRVLPSTLRLVRAFDPLIRANFCARHHAARCTISVMTFLGLLSRAWVLISASALGACSTETPATLEAKDAGGDASTAARDAAGNADSSADAGASATWCGALAEKQDRCDNNRECGNDFSAWCSAQSKTNSLAFEQADLACLPAADCTNAKRTDCRYKLYAETQLTQAQRGLAAAYCATCTGTGATCMDETLKYDASKGPQAVTDSYVAVWELSDSIVATIQTKCTGAALPGKEGDCPKAFGSCAAEYYLNALPSCP
jgi:hypothetical protein